MNSISLAFALFLLLPQDADLARQLGVGEKLEGEVSDSAPAVATPTLDASYTNAPTVGLGYRFTVQQSGIYVIDCRSFEFDSYLVLRDSKGVLLAEDDDGLIAAHARIVATLEQDEIYELSACALYGARGTFELALTAGAPEPESPESQAMLLYEEASAELAHLEKRHGPDHPETIVSANRLASVLTRFGAYAHAKPLLERVLAAYEAELGPDHDNIATCLNELAICLRSMGEYAEAKPLFERALAIYESTLGPNHRNTVICINNLGTLFYSMGEYENAKPLFERAIEIDEATVGYEHAGTASNLSNLAKVHEMLGELELAKELLLRALKIHEATGGPENLEAASCLLNLAGVMRTMGDDRSAQQLLERALAINEAKLGPNHHQTALTLGNLGSVLEHFGEYAEAKPLFERCLAIMEAVFGPEHPNSIGSLINLSGVLLRIGDYQAARVLLERSLSVVEQAHGPDHLLTAKSLSHLAGLLKSIGDYKTAQPLFERVVAIREAQLGPIHEDTAAALNNLAIMLDSVGDYENALPLYERALAIHEELLGATHPRTAVSLSNLASVYVSIGNPEAAKPLLERSLTIRETELGAEHPLTAIGLNDLASVFEGEEDYEQAIELNLRALAICESQLGPDHINTASVLSSLGDTYRASGEPAKAEAYYERCLEVLRTQLGPDHPHTGRALNMLALIQLDIGHPKQAWETMLTGLVGTGEHFRNQLLARTREESGRYLATSRWQQELLLSVPRHLPSVEVEWVAASKLFDWKGQIGRAARMVRKLTRESEQARVLSARLRASQVELARLAYESDASVDGRTARIQKVKREVSALELDLRELVGADSVDPLKLRELRELLPENAALLSFYVQAIYEPARFEEEKVVADGQWSEPHLVAWIIRPEREVVSVDLGLAERLKNSTTDFLGALASSPTSSSTATPEQARGVVLGVEDGDTGTNQALRELIWDPLIPHLDGASLVIVSHDQFTATLPFEVLKAENDRYLIEDRSFVYLQDLQEIAAFGDEPDRELATLFCVGDVDFNRRSKALALEAGHKREQESAPSESWVTWPNLANTITEIETIRSLHEEFYPDGERFVLTGADATEERVLADLPNASIVHLATHGFFEPQNLASMRRSAEQVAARHRNRATRSSNDSSLEIDRKLTGYLPEVLSGLVFAGVNLEREEGRLDGYLTAADVDWMDLSGVELVTLSACETGLGRSESGEGMSGFRTTLLRAGVSTIVSSLWTIPDNSTERLMGRFYKNLLRHKLGKLESLREAQLWMLSENRRKFDGEGLPYTWGAFVLSGDWR